jgi:hypothetical protein
VIQDLRYAEQHTPLFRVEQAEKTNPPPQVENIVFEMPEEQSEEDYLKAILDPTDED